MMRIVFVISDLQGGGAQRVAVTLIGRWVGAGWDVHVVTLAEQATDFFELPAGVSRSVIHVPRQRTGLRAAVLNNRDRVAALRRELRLHSTDVVVSFLDTVNVLSTLAVLGSEIPVVVSERIDPRHHRIGLMWRALRRLSYRRASAVVVQTESVAVWARAAFGRHRVRVIPNPISSAWIGSTPRTRRSPVVASVGRLSIQKGPDVLLRAFGQLADQRPDWTLRLAGDGEMRRELEELAAELRISDRVEFLGRIRDVQDVLGSASIYVLASRYEGFPNALLEAMAAGLAVISTRCPSGPTEMIADGVDGLLVPVGSVDALASAMLSLMGDPHQRESLGAAAAEAVTHRYSLERVGGLWDDLLRAVSGTS